MQHCYPSAKLLTQLPVPIWQVEMDFPGEHQLPSFDLLGFLIELQKEHPDSKLILGCDYRGVPYEKLTQVLKSGVDVEPTDSHIYVDFIDKAWEYGGWPKIILAFDTDSLKHTYVETTFDINPDEMNRLKVIYPSSLISKNGKSVWLSRLPEGDPRIASTYETQYARYIPGNPFDALRYVLVFTPHGQDIAA